MKLFKDYLLVVIGSFFMGLGIALTKCAELGVSTFSSVPNVVNIRFDSISIGTWSAIWNIIMILSQMLILRRQFKIVELMQIPVSVFMGWCMDLGVWMFSHFPTDVYIAKLSMTIVGVIVLGFGIAVTVIADRVMNPAEAIVNVIAKKIKRSFSSIKIIFDVLCVVFAVVLSLLFFDFKVVGIREGTIIAIFLTGPSISFFLKLFKRRFKQ